MEVLWRIRCRYCVQPFEVCPACGRVRVCCSDLCAGRGRSESVRAARRKHRSSEEGRLDHRDQERARRDRRARERLGRVGDQYGESLPMASIVARHDPRKHHGHDSGDRLANADPGQPRVHRPLDREAGPVELGTPGRARSVDRGPGLVVPGPCRRCSVCDVRGDSVVDRPHRWPWVRNQHPLLRHPGASRAPPRTSSARARGAARTVEGHATLRTDRSSRSLPRGPAQSMGTSLGAGRIASFTARKWRASVVTITRA